MHPPSIITLGSYPMDSHVPQAHQCGTPSSGLKSSSWGEEDLRPVVAAVAGPSTAPGALLWVSPGPQRTPGWGGGISSPAARCTLSGHFCAPCVCTVARVTSAVPSAAHTHVHASTREPPRPPGPCSSEPPWDPQWAPERRDRVVSSPLARP